MCPLGHIPAFCELGEEPLGGWMVVEISVSLPFQGGGLFQRLSVGRTSSLSLHGFRWCKRAVASRQGVEIRHRHPLLPGDFLVESSQGLAKLIASDTLAVCGRDKVTFMPTFAERLIPIGSVGATASSGQTGAA